ncbi:MAG: cobyrinate a,c-diamide synthase [Nocardioides sp.]|uniref:cobyrinate a,c-diamide synthase n=1 Tax=Nocardioides sp. TaxID=35761 RepID=UPI0039E250D3
MVNPSTALPRLVVSAPASGQGKTTVATGLMAALRATGRAVSGHKVGPDYIDPGFHAVACGRPGRNLDVRLVGEELIVPLLLHGAAGAEIAVIEGVMGLYDGKVGADGLASTAQVAALTDSPVLLVVDASAASRSVAAVVHGLATFPAGTHERVRIGGVVLNKVGSARHRDEVCGAMERLGIPVLGSLPHDADLRLPGRHLGLVPAAERAESAAVVDVLAERLAEHLDLDAILALAGTAPELSGAPWDPREQVEQIEQVVPVGRVAPDRRERPVVAVAGGRAFTFRYAETDELLRAAGCDVVPFDPALDRALPAGTRGIYLGGGFPEMHAADLAQNHSLLAELRAAVAAGVPTVAECAGLLYLCRSLDGVPMVGAIDADAAMSERLTLSYPVLTADHDTLLTRAGDRVTAHEFHRTRISPAHPSPDSGLVPAWCSDGRPAGFAGPTLHASYLHVHWAGHPRLARRFAEAVHLAPPRAAWCRPAAYDARPAGSGTAPPAGTPRPSDPLRHHGDLEVRDRGLVDLAVNVYAGPRPSWLDEALHAALDRAQLYPDPAEAERAIAAGHGLAPDRVLATAGAAEAFTLLARLRRWRRPVVIHPQFTEPHAALVAAGHTPEVTYCRAADGFRVTEEVLAQVAADADLVLVGNPTNPTGVLHPRTALEALRRPGRLVVVDEAFMDTIPGEPESLLRSGPGELLDGVVVLRSLTKHWSIPGIRAGYLVGDPGTVADLRAVQTPWSVSTPALAALRACAGDRARSESTERAVRLGSWRDHLTDGLTERGIEQVPSATSFVLARPGAGVHERLRARGVAVRRADTFPGLDDRWVRIAVRPPEPTDRLLTVLDTILDPVIDPVIDTVIDRPAEGES